jgi:hypothetical protein
MKINKAEEYFSAKRLLRAPTERITRPVKKRVAVSTTRRNAFRPSRSVSLSQESMQRGINVNLNRLRCRKEEHNLRKSWAGFIRISPKPG